MPLSDLPHRLTNQSPLPTETPGAAPRADHKPAAKETRGTESQASALRAYPKEFEDKIGFSALLSLVSAECSNQIGKELVLHLRPSNMFQAVRHRLQRAGEMMTLLRSTTSFPLLNIQDLRPTLKRIARPGTYLGVEELPQLLRAANLFALLPEVLCRKTELPSPGNGTRGEQASASPSAPREEQFLYPTLAQILPTIAGVREVAQAIGRILDKEGNIADNASPQLLKIRTEGKRLRTEVSRVMARMLQEAARDGLLEEDARPTIRQGRPVIPVPAANKSRLPGIVHDESATGRTIFIEPLAVVEVNNALRENQAQEQREIVRILTELTDMIRPFTPGMHKMYLAVGRVDAVYAVASFALKEHAVIPELSRKPLIRWQEAVHPLLRRTLKHEGKEIVPLDITLQAPAGRILLISGPNAGGKSVCLKTVGLLQYMLQSGIPIPVHPDSLAGIFSYIALDIGDNQSIENDLSTYSSHLKHMRTMAAMASPAALLLIDEFGSGTEPEIGGAIAEGLLKLFNEQGAWGVITTHYRNLKEYAEATPGIRNGAMLFDREHLRPLFKLSMGHPGSSFAIEIARKQGIPKGVLDYASAKVGEDLLRSDSYVQDIAREKERWESKRREVESRQQHLEEVVSRYEQKLRTLQEKHNTIVRQAQEEAKEIVESSRARVERTIKEIVESKADKEITKQARADLQEYARSELPAQDTARENSRIEREIAKIERRNERKKQKKNTPAAAPEKTPVAPQKLRDPLPGDRVLVKSKNIQGELLSLSATEAQVQLGDFIKLTVKRSDVALLPDSPAAVQVHTTPDWARKSISNITDQILSKKSDFPLQLDVRGMRVSEADQAVQYYIDDAVSVGVDEVRILHGTGTGALRTYIRELLRGLRCVKEFRDEDVRFGGAGITVVTLF